MSSASVSRPRASATALAMAAGAVIVVPSPSPLAPRGVTGEGDSTIAVVGSGQLGGGRGRVVDERGGEQVAGVVVDVAFEQGGAEAVGQAAEHLAFGQRAVQDPAGVVDGDVVPDRHFAGLGVDLDDGDVGQEAVGRRGVDGVVGGRGGQPGDRERGREGEPVDAVGQAGRVPVGGAGHPAERHRPVGAYRPPGRSRRPARRRRGRIQHVGGDGPHPLGQLGGGRVHGAGHGDGEAAGVVARADGERPGGGVGAGMDGDVLGPHPEGVGDDPRPPPSGDPGPGAST